MCEEQCYDTLPDFFNVVIATPTPSTSFAPGEALTQGVDVTSDLGLHLAGATLADSSHHKQGIGGIYGPHYRIDFRAGI